MILDKRTIQNFKLPSSFSIQDINNINLIDFAYSQGYSEPKKNSAASVVLENKSTGDKIIVNKNTNNQYYFNPDNDNDNGKLYHFILNRLNAGIQVLANPTGFEKRSVFVIAANYLNTPQEEVNLTPEITKNKPTPKLGDNLNIKPLLKKEFLKSRDISNNTLTNPKFKNHIFNAYAPGKTEGTFIPNIAFPLYDSINLNKVTGYEIRNNNFKSILGNHTNLWHSEIPKDLNEISTIVFGESAIDCLSHFELNKKENKDTVYFSFSGNIYGDKIETFLKSIAPLIEKNPNINFKSITDNDHNGSKYDFRILTSFINNFNKGRHIEFEVTKPTLNFHIHDFIDSVDTIFDIHLKELKKSLETFNSNLSPLFSKGTANQRKNTIDLQLPNTDLSYNEIFNFLAKTYLEKFNMTLEKAQPKFNDWNEELQKSAREQKKTNNFKI